MNTVETMQSSDNDYQLEYYRRTINSRENISIPPTPILLNFSLVFDSSWVGSNYLSIDKLFIF